MRRPCLERGCRAYVLKPASRCARHERGGGSRVNRATGERYDSRAWRARSREARAAWVEEHGLVCPGWQVPAHWVSRPADLCLDHDVGVLCRACNGRKGGGWDKRRDMPAGE